MNTPSLSRRNFMKSLGLAGVGSALASQAAAQTPASDAPQTVPLRPFGKTGEKVSILALGGIFDITSNQLMLQRALDFGVTYWDTANSYNNGNSERGIGMYFEKNPDARKKVFLVTKAGGGRNANNLNARLEESFRRLKTDYIDLFLLHGVGSGNELTDEVKAWAEKAKADKKIRFFGFSTHSNMAQTLSAAAKLDWIDGIMLRYDYRNMRADDMRAAMDACEKAGIGLTAMKTQGGGPIKLENEADVKLAGHFMNRGFSEHQAKLKAVWENPQIASICSQMTNVTVLTANVAAALDKAKLSAADRAALWEYAEATCTRYCGGCTQLCEEAMGRVVAVGDVMRSLMYEREYGDSRLARETLSQLPPGARDLLLRFDFTAAEAACPNRLPVARLMREAAMLLG